MTLEMTRQSDVNQFFSNIGMGTRQDGFDKPLVDHMMDVVGGFFADDQAQKAQIQLAQNDNKPAIFEELSQTRKQTAGSEFFNTNIKSNG